MMHGNVCIAEAMSKDVLQLALCLQDGTLRELYDARMTRQEEENAGFDLVIPSDVSIPPRATVRIDHKVAAMVTCSSGASPFILGTFPEGTERVAYCMYPRSSMSRTTLMLCNSVGVIDRGYNGTLQAVVHNYSADTSVALRRGDRLFQVCHPTLRSFAHVCYVDTLPASKRGVGGFGSTGGQAVQAVRTPNPT